MVKVSCYIFIARSDAPFIRSTLPPLFRMADKVGCKIMVILDASNVKGILGETLFQSELSEVIKILEEIQEKHPFEMKVYLPKPYTVLELSKMHFGKPYRETHCFRGYPIHGSIYQFYQDDSRYILHLDCDMIFYEKEGFSWMESGIELMEKNEDILCTLPRGGPPSNNGELQQGTTNYIKDNSRCLYLFKNFTSRHYLIHRERFLSLLPLKPLWLSWRDPIKSRLFGNGKMLCWEAMVEYALEKSQLWRADLMSDQAWSLHPGDRSKKFYQLLPQIIKSVHLNEFPEKQRGHFDLKLNDWKHFLN